MARTGKKAEPEFPKVKQLALDLPVDFVLTLDAFCDAAWGVSRAKIIREAVAEFVRKELDKNPGLQERYDVAEQRLRKERIKIVPMKPKSDDE